jgi:hypothetical protein
MQSPSQATDGREYFEPTRRPVMATTTMNAMNASLSGVRYNTKSSRTPSLAMVKFLQQRAALPEMPEQDSHLSAFASVTLRLAAAAVPVGALAWLAVAG